MLRCAGSTVHGVCRQVVIEAGLYVGTALLISLVPLAVTTTGESLFYARAGLALVVRPGVGPVLLVALLVLPGPGCGAARSDPGCYPNPDRHRPGGRVRIGGRWGRLWGGRQEWQRFDLRSSLLGLTLNSFKTINSKKTSEQ